MQLFLHLTVVLVVVVTTAADDDPSSRQVPILRSDNSHDSFGRYNFHYRTGNGIEREESGSQADGQVSRGGWSYTSPEGLPVDITFVAGHGGYQPRGSVIPVAPPLPYQRN